MERNQFCLLVHYREGTYVRHRLISPFDLWESLMGRIKQRGSVEKPEGVKRRDETGEKLAEMEQKTHRLL